MLSPVLVSFGVEIGGLVRLVRNRPSRT